MLIKFPAQTTILLPLMMMLLGNAIAHSLFMIGFPIIGRSMGLTELQTGSLLSVSAFAMLIVSPLWGRYTDKSGRKKPILTGILTTALFLILTAGLMHYQIALTTFSLSTCFGLLFVLRLLQSIGVAGLMPGAQAYVADQTPLDKRLSGMSLIGATFGFGSIVGGYLVMYAGIQNFTSVLLVLGIIMLLTSFGHRSLKPVASHLQQPMPATARLPTRRFLPYALITFCVLLVYGLLQQTTGLRLQDQLGFSAAEAMRGSGGLLTASMLCMAIGQVILSCFAPQRPGRLMLTGLTLGMLCLTGLVLADTYQEMLVSMAGLGGAMSLIIPTNLTLLSQTAGPEHQAYAASVNIIGKGLGWAAGPISGALLYQFTPVLPVWSSMGLFIIAAVIACFLIRQQTAPETSYQPSV